MREESERREVSMKRLMAASVLMLGCVIGFAAAFEDGPYLGVRFIETRDKKVRITSIDPKALAWQMGLRENDVFVTVSGKKVESSETVQATLKAIKRENGATFDIEVERLVSAELNDFKAGDLEILGKLLVKKEDGSKSKSVKIDIFADGKDVKKMSVRPTKQQSREPRRITLKGVIRESSSSPGLFYATFRSGIVGAPKGPDAKKDAKGPEILPEKDR
jgi:hypothetical protein